MKVRGFGRDLDLVLASFFLCILGYIGLNSFLGNLYMVRLGYDVTFVGRANSVNTLIYGALSLPAGFLVSRWGLRRSMLIGALLCVVKLAVFASVELLPAPLRGASLIASMVPGGAGGALYLACVIPCLMEAEASRRAAALSAYSMANLVAASLGMFAGGALTALSARLTASPAGSPAPYRLGLAIAVVVQIGSAVCVALMRRDTVGRHTQKTAHDPELLAAARAPGPLLAVAAVTMFLITILGVSLQTFLSLHLDQSFKVPTQSIGTALAVAGGVSAGAFALAPVLIRRLGAYWTAALSSVSACLVAASVGLASGWLVAAGGYALMSLLSSLGTPATALLYQEAVAAGARPIVTGVSNAAFGLGSSVALFAGGSAISFLGYGRFFLAGCALQLLGVAIFVLYFGLRKRRQASVALAVS